MACRDGSDGAQTAGEARAGDSVTCTDDTANLSPTVSADDKAGTAASRPAAPSE